MIAGAFHAQPFAVVDLETTGLSARSDRAIEVAVVRVEHGRATLVFESLLDPGRPIPPFITRLTGISSEMVRGCPSLDEALPELERVLQGTIVAAHNAAFDSSFLGAASARQGRRLTPPWLCTARLARRLLPSRRSYRLRDLASWLALPVEPRHRARADAETAAHLLLRLLEQADAQEVQIGDLVTLAGLGGGPQARASVDEAVLRTLPEGPGVYLLRDGAGEVLYVGKSTHVRRRVREHLRQADQRGGHADQPRLRRLLPSVRDVAAVASGDELEALFLESTLIKRYQPAGNVLQRRERDLPFVRVDLHDPFPRLEVARQNPDDHALYFGPYRRADQAVQAVELLQSELGLRACDGPIRPGQRACYLLDLRRCLGPCVGAVSEGAYRGAVERAVECLSGRDRSVLARMAERRDGLAQQLRFEEAAQLRDRLRALEWLVGDGRPRRLDERNLVVVGPAHESTQRELFYVRGGRVARRDAATIPADATALGMVLHQVYTEPSSDTWSRQAVDELWILERWMAQRRKWIQVVPVAPQQPLDALPSLLEALGAGKVHPGESPPPIMTAAVASEHAVTQAGGHDDQATITGPRQHHPSAEAHQPRRSNPRGERG